MLKFLASWKKYLPPTDSSGSEVKERLKGLVKTKGLYLVLLLALLGGSYYLVTNDAVFNNSGTKTYIIGSDSLPGRPAPDEALTGAATVPPELMEQPGAHSAPAAAPESPSLVPPLPGQISTGYGFAYAPTFGDYRFHPGVDFVAPAGTEVRAAAAGLVKQVEYGEAWKYRLVIDISDDYQTVYAHLDSIAVAKGDRVETGEVLGTIGEPGAAEGGTRPHLHFELLKNGNTVDPLPAMQ